jgi:hypothetical protein
MGAREEVVGDLTPDTSNSAPATSGKLGRGFSFAPHTRLPPNFRGYHFDANWLALQVTAGAPGPISRVSDPLLATRLGIRREERYLTSTMRR